MVLENTHDSLAKKKENLPKYMTKKWYYNQAIYVKSIYQSSVFSMLFLELENIIDVPNVWRITTG